jgi:RNA polymerase sigma-70 factor, ECF subfamily
LATKLATLHADADPARRAEPVPEHEHIPDDRLQLMFACCHPALDLDMQIGLTLRYIAGLSTAELVALLGPGPVLEGTPSPDGPGTGRCPG